MPQSEFGDPGSAGCPEDASATKRESSGGNEVESFAFLLNVGRLVDADSFELAPGHILRRATAEEKAVVKTVLENIPGPFMPLRNLLWERQWPEVHREYRRAVSAS